MDRNLKRQIVIGAVLIPDTKVTLQRYKEPLTPVIGGYGYIGTIAYNKKKTHVQCHICGFFFRSLGLHVSRTHGIPPKLYKDRYGLMRKTSLLAPPVAKRLGELTSLKNAEKTKEEIRANLARGQITQRKQRESLEYKNIKGRCPEQLLRKVLFLAEELNKTPSKRDFIKKYGNGGDLKSVFRTFETWNNAVKELGLKPN